MKKRFPSCILLCDKHCMHIPRVLEKLREKHGIDYIIEAQQKLLRTIKTKGLSEEQLKELNNPRLLKTSFKTFRHFRGTELYHKTRDILHVKETLGHKNVQNTLIYIHLEAAIFKIGNDEFTVRTVKTAEEAKKLLEVGFEYVTEVEGVKLFRKRK